MHRLVTIVFLAVFVVGCRTTDDTASTVAQSGPPGFESRSGDLTAFLIAEVQNTGGQAKDPADAKPLQAEWYFKRDDQGFQILLFNQTKEAVADGLTNALGETKIRSDYPQMVYKPEKIGVAVMVDLENQPISIICIKKTALP